MKISFRRAKEIANAAISPMLKTISLKLYLGFNSTESCRLLHSGERQVRSINSLSKKQPMQLNEKKFLPCVEIRSPFAHFSDLDTRNNNILAL